MATFSDYNFIFICYSKDMKIPINYFYTERVKKQKSAVRQQKKLIFEKKVVLQNHQWSKPDNSRGQAL